MDEETGYEGIHPAQDPDEVQEPLNGADPTVDQEVPPDAVQAETVFLIVIGLDGRAYPELDPNKNHFVRRPATPADVAPACWQVETDYQAMKTGAHIAAIMEQQAQRAMAQMQAMQQAQAAQQQLVGLGDLRQAPNRSARRHGG